MHCTSLHFTSVHFTSLHFTSPIINTLHSTQRFNPLHCTALHFTSLHFTSPIINTLHSTQRFNPLHCTALHYTSLHFTSLHCTFRQFTTHSLCLQFTTLITVLTLFLRAHKWCVQWHCSHNLGGGKGWGCSFRSTSKHFAFANGCKETGRRNTGWKNLF